MKAPQNWLWNKCSEIQKDYFKLCLLNITYYLYYTQGAFKIVQQGFEKDIPAGYELAFPERLPVHLDSRLMTRFLFERLKDVPCLPEE